MTVAIGELNRWVSAEKMARVALSTVFADYKLVACNPVSVVASVLQLASVGLVPDGFLGQAYLVPFGGVAEPMIGFRGFGELIVRSGKANSHDAQVVSK